MSSVRPTYGDLMRVAERHAAWASIGLVTERIADRAGAEAAFVAYGELFAAVRLHVERLMGGPRRIEGMAWSDWTNPADRAGLRLVQELARLRPSPERRLVGFGQPTVSWVAAARALGAAGDLLATHTAANGLPRTPDASAWSDGAVRAVGYSHVADLVGTLCSADRDLALRSGQAGMPWGAVKQRLPNLDRIDAAALELHQVARQELGFEATSARLDTMTVARPPVRVHDPVLELHDRIDRLRLGAWNLARHPQRGSVYDLAEYAAGVVVMHTHLAAHADPEQPGPRGRDALLQEREGWAAVVRHLSRLGSAATATSAVRSEVHSIATAAQLAFPMVRDPTGVHADGPRRECPALTDHLLEAGHSIAASNRATLQVQAARDLVYLHARHLPGERVTEDPYLVTAKLEGRYVLAAPVDVDEVLTAYAPRLAIRRTPVLEPVHVEPPSIGGLGF